MPNENFNGLGQFSSLSDIQNMIPKGLFNRQKFITGTSGLSYGSKTAFSHILAPVMTLSVDL